MRTAKAHGQKSLFPHVERNAGGQLLSELSKMMGRYMTAIGIKSGRETTLYSLRHGEIDAMRRAGHTDDVIGFIVGHGRDTMTARYGIVQQGAVELRAPVVASICYPGLDLCHLKACS